jgi:hypothetical protein
MYKRAATHTIGHNSWDARKGCGRPLLGYQAALSLGATSRGRECGLEA